MVKIAALLCGLLAGLFALVVPLGLGLDLLTPSLKLWGTSPSQHLLGTLAWYAVPAAAILGALLAVVTPGLGALLMLAAALAWAGFGVEDQSFLRYELLVPAGASLLGALLAFLGGELELRRRRTARRNRRVQVEESALRAEKERHAREAAFSVDPRTVPREEAPPRPAREIPLTLEDIAPAEKVSEPPRRTETIWPDAPTRKPLFERPDPGPEFPHRIPSPGRPVTPASREYREVEQPRRERYRDLYEDEPRTRGPNRLLVWLAAVNGIAVIGLGTAVGYLMLEDQRTTPQTVAAVTETAPVAKPAVPEAAPVVPAKTEVVTPAPAPLPVLESPQPAEGKGETGPALPMLADATVPAVADSKAITSPQSEASVAEAIASYTDPYAYCAAIKTIDFVDSRYAGPRFTPDMANALRVPLKSSPDRVSWRCVDGTVYACASFDWPACAMTPTADEMRDYCQRNPGVTRLLAPNGTWSCDGNRPKIPDGERWPVDARGFLPNAWIPVLPTETQPTG